MLAEGRLVNLATPKGMGHPIEVMDLSFALQARSRPVHRKEREDLKGGVYEVPHEIDEQVAHLKLTSLGVSIDTNQRQKKYQSAAGISGRNGWVILLKQHFLQKGTSGIRASYLFFRRSWFVPDLRGFVLMAFDQNFPASENPFSLSGRNFLLLPFRSADLSMHTDTP